MSANDNDRRQNVDPDTAAAKVEIFNAFGRFDSAATEAANSEILGAATVVFVAAPPTAIVPGKPTPIVDKVATKAAQLAAKVKVLANRK
jgi:hypothetical protein